MVDPVHDTAFQAVLTARESVSRQLGPIFFHTASTAWKAVSPTGPFGGIV